jgi:uncharacterized membrane protein
VEASCRKAWEKSGVIRQKGNASENLVYLKLEKVTAAKGDVMKKSVIVIFAVAATACCAELYAIEQTPPPSGHSLGSVTGGDFRQKANMVIQKKCTACHSSKVIEQAIAAGKNMQKIQQRMEQKGVKLSANDRTVLGVFWQRTPLKRGK